MVLLTVMFGLMNWSPENNRIPDHYLTSIVFPL